MSEQETLPEMTPEQLKEFQQVFHISISVSNTFKLMMETSIETGNFELVRPFIQHLLNDCNNQLAEAKKPKSQIITLS